jgi:hypothetical protein
MPTGIPTGAPQTNQALQQQAALLMKR